MKRTWRTKPSVDVYLRTSWGSKTGFNVEEYRVQVITIIIYVNQASLFFFLRHDQNSAAMRTL